MNKQIMIALGILFLFFLLRTIFKQKNYHDDRSSEVGLDVAPEKGLAAPLHELTAEQEGLIKQLIDEKRTIDAIKYYRTVTGSNLKPAKDAVEAMMTKMSNESEFPSESR